MKKDIEPFSVMLKDLQTALKIFQKSLKSNQSEAEISKSQIAFLKIAKNLLSLFKNSPNEPSFNTLKKQAENLIGIYKNTCINNQPLEMPTEVLNCSLEEDKESYNNPEDLNSKISYIRSQEIEKLHKEMAELNEIFRDFSGLVNEQGVMLEQIKFEVEVAERTTERVNIDLSQAKELQKQGRSKYCLIFFIFLFLLAVIGGIVAGVLLSK